MIKTFGQLNDAQAEPFLKTMAHPANFYCALCDRQSLWDSETINSILEAFPKGYIDEGDLFLILAECIANAVLHGQAEVLGIHARRRGSILLISFLQSPPMQARVGIVLSYARQGKITECATELPGGLGFPILLKLAHKITISSDKHKLQLWIKVKDD